MRGCYKRWWAAPGQTGPNRRMLCAFFPFCPAPMTHTDTHEATPTPIHASRPCIDELFTARLTKNEADAVLALSVTRHC